MKINCLNMVLSLDGIKMNACPNVTWDALLAGVH